MKITKKHLFSILFLVTITWGVVFLGTVARADDSLLNTQTGMGEINQVYGGKEPQDVRITIAKIINVALTFIGVIFFALTIYAGFQYMTAAGNQEQSKKALSLLKNAIIGLLIVLMAWAITRYSIQILSKTVNGSVVDYTHYNQYGN